MSVWIVLPIRSFTDGKRRLASALDPGKRAALVHTLFVRTLERAAEFPGLTRTLVVSPSREARATASSRGAHVLADEGVGLNAALVQARAFLAGQGASLMLVVSSDLPFLDADDLRRLTQAASATTIALASDRSRQGTNAICLPVSAAFDFSFGPDSFARHLDRARSLGFTATEVDRPGLAFDVDLPAHLLELVDLELREM